MNIRQVILWHSNLINKLEINESIVSLYPSTNFSQINDFYIKSSFPYKNKNKFKELDKSSVLLFDELYNKYKDNKLMKEFLNSNWDSNKLKELKNNIERVKIEKKEIR